MNNSSTTPGLVGYARFSTNTLALGDSLDAQEEAIRVWGITYEHEVGRVYRDGGLSGTLDETQRPGLLEALRAIKNGEASGLVVHRLDRLARSLHVQEAVLAEVWKAGGTVWEAVGNAEVLRDDPSDPMRTFVRQVMGAANQLERGLVIARLQGGRRRKKLAGGYIGGRPGYGYAVQHGQLVPIPEEQEVLTWLREEHGRGRTFQSLADELNERGVPAKLGGLWRLNTVRSVLVNSAGRQPAGTSATAR